MVGGGWWVVGVMGESVGWGDSVCMCVCVCVCVWCGCGRGGVCAGRCVRACVRAWGGLSAATFLGDTRVCGGGWEFSVRDLIKVGWGSGLGWGYRSGWDF